jgi:antitoxin (DNA-binding transcriptional repressor) of toxin-antitoxin stability system
METQKVGIREFRDKLSTYLLESDKPVTITRHGDTIGFYLPAPRKRTDAEREAFRQAAARWDAEMKRVGVTEDDLMDDFKQWRKDQKKGKRKG